MVVGAGMFIFGLAMMGQVSRGPMGGPGSAFMALWLLATAGIAVFHGYNSFSQRGVAFMEVELDGELGSSGGTASSGNSGGNADFESRLRQLVRPRDDGLITEDEFRRKRAEIMDSNVVGGSR